MKEMSESHWLCFSNSCLFELCLSRCRSPPQGGFSKSDPRGSRLSARQLTLYSLVLAVKAVINTQLGDFHDMLQK